jgi:murein DD-endopeptidase MepM/ murein hydrolase activator NlpD
MPNKRHHGVSVHLILVSDRLTTAKTITLSARHFLLAAIVFVLLVLGTSTAFSYLTVRYAAYIRLPELQTMLRSLSAEERERTADISKENINAMAVKLGEMQAQLIRLGTLGERLAGAAGVKINEIKVNDARSDGRGGPLVQPAQMTTGDLQRAIDALSREVESHTDSMSLIESQLLEDRIRRNLLPTSVPVNVQWNASTFGWRIDPFTGQRALHEGVDFAAPVGVPIRAAAAGVVVTAAHHAEYGNVVEIDHGQGLTTRYAHAATIAAKEGSFVKRGEAIATVGNTGRSTGPHLHFEVRMNGVPQNPDRFLRLAQSQTAPLTAKR